MRNALGQISSKSNSGREPSSSHGDDTARINISSGYLPNTSLSNLFSFSQQQQQQQETMRSRMQNNNNRNNDNNNNIPSRQMTMIMKQQQQQARVSSSNSLYEVEDDFHSTSHVHDLYAF